MIHRACRPRLVCYTYRGSCHSKKGIPLSKFTETVRANTSNGSVSCTITVYGEGLSERRGRQAADTGAASASCKIGHIAQKLHDAATKSKYTSVGIKTSTQSMTIDGITVRVTIRARYDKVSSTLLMLLIQDAPSDIVKTVSMKVLGIDERDIMRELGEVLGEGNPLSRLMSEMSDEPGFGGMPPFGQEQAFGRYPREPVGAHNGSGLGQYL